MDNSLIFVIIIMFYFCVIFPLQLRRYVRNRQLRLQLQRPTTVNDTSYTRTRTVTYQNNNSSRNGQSSDPSDHHVIFGVSQETESRTEDEIAAARHLEAEHRQQIIDIQREIEQQAIQRRDLNVPNLPSRIINSSTGHDRVAEYSQQIIDMQREIEQEAIRRHQERRTDSGPHMPPRLINSSTIRSSIYTITSGGGTIGVSNSSINYPHAPPLTPDSDGMRQIPQIRFPDRSNSKDDELPSYDQAVAFDSTTTSVTIRRY